MSPVVSASLLILNLATNQLRQQREIEGTQRSRHHSLLWHTQIEARVRLSPIIEAGEEDG